MLLQLPLHQTRSTHLPSTIRNTANPIRVESVSVFRFPVIRVFFRLCAVYFPKSLSAALATPKMLASRFPPLALDIPRVHLLSVLGCIFQPYFH